MATLRVEMNQNNANLHISDHFHAFSSGSLEWIYREDPTVWPCLPGRPLDLKSPW